jgi:hypothetical protein
MFRRAVATIFALLCLLPAIAAAAPPGDDLSAARLLPASTAIYAEIPHPGKAVDLVLDHPIHGRLRQVDDYQKAFKTPQYQQFQLAVKVLEGAVDMRWRPALQLLTEGGVYFAADPQTEGMAILIKAGDGEKLTALQEAVFTFARADAKQKGHDDPVQTGEYRGVTAHAINNARFAIVGDWLVLTNKSELGKAVLDRYLDAGEIDAGPPGTLAGNVQFQEAQKLRPQDALAWSYFDLKTLREAGVAKKFFAGPKDNPLAELLLGGVIAMATQAPFTAWTLQADAERLAVSASLPFNAEWIGESRVYYFGPEGKGVAPPLAVTKDTVFSLSTFRDLGEFWASAPELFDDNINAKFSEVDSQLTTLFSGRDFGAEVLGSLRPEVQIVVARQKLPQADLPTPDIKLPAFAAIHRLKDEAKVRRNLKVSFQSLIGFLNVVGAQNGQPPLELSNETIEGGEIISGQYLPPGDPDDANRGKINYNFSPTAAFVGDKLIISSTKALATELAASTQAGHHDQAAGAAQVNTQSRLHSSVLRLILEDNREQLIAQNMLEKGHSREEAEKEIGALLEILSWVRSAGVRLSHDDRLLRLEWSVALSPPASLDRK